MSARFSHALMLDRELKRNIAPLWSASSAKGVVATAHYLATDAAVGILEGGGNAIDAAVAASLALGVCEAAGSGLGGMTMMVIHSAGSGRTFAISGACHAPALATPEAVSGSRRYRGHGAVAAPTNVAVLAHVLKRYGRMKLSQVLAPSIALADEGYPLTKLQHTLLVKNANHLKRGPAAPLFLDAAGEPYPEGATFRQPVLARTLRRLGRTGLEDFYVGEIASEICRDIQTHGGFLGENDLAGALRVDETTPLRMTFRGDDVMTLGPPAGGLALLQMLRMASFLTESELDMDDAEGAARVAAIIGRARKDRREFRFRIGADAVGDGAELLDEGYAKRAVEEALECNTAHEVADYASPSAGGGETTHVSVMDIDGNTVSLTQSIERSFGSAVATPSLGFLYNGYLRAFKVENENHPYFLRPGARARSNAAPTIVLRQGRARVCLGSTGSERMASGILQVLLRLCHSSPFESVHAPRLHCTPERKVLWEEERFPRGFRETLLGRGFAVQAMKPYSFKMGGLQLAVRQDGQSVGVADPRRDGAAGVPVNIEKPGEGRPGA